LLICFVIIQLLPLPRAYVGVQREVFLVFFPYSCYGLTVVHLLVATSTKNLPDSRISHSLAHPLPSDLDFVSQYEVKIKTFSSYEYGGVVGFVVCNIYSHHDSAPLSLVLL